MLASIAAGRREHGSFVACERLQQPLLGDRQRDVMEATRRVPASRDPISFDATRSAGRLSIEDARG